jgi:outer membrane protein, heavy metal efflux system
MKRLLIVAFTLSAMMNGFAQSSIENVLSEIERNNKTLISQKQYRETETLALKTGLNPENPTVKYEYLPGRPEGAGTQKDLIITQSFDFPTSYTKRRNVSNARIEHLDLEYQVARQEILLQAKQTCINYIHRLKLQAELNKRMQHANALHDAFSRMTERGESNILDLNKVRLLQLDIRNQTELNLTELKRLQLILDELNGGAQLDLSSLEYPDIDDVLPFETLDSLIEANDPVVKSIRQERNVNKEQVELSRALVLPKFQGGYHRQSILGQTYQGVQGGMTIPLWENKNRVKTEQARLAFSQLQVTEHRTKHFYENKQLYEQYTHWQNSFSAYQAILTSANNDELLSKAFQAGELSLIAYLMELRYFYDAITASLESEKLLHQAVTSLYKFQL